MGAPGDSVAVRDPIESREHASLLVRASRAGLLDTLAGGLVHEARNPLNAMAIHLEVLADKLRDPASGELPAHLARNLDAARNQVRRLDGLLRRFGDFASGRIEGDDVGGCFARVVDLCEYYLRRAGVEVEPTGTLQASVASPAPVCHVLLELLFHALAAAPRGSRIRLEAAVRGDRLALAVEGAAGAAGDGAERPSLEVASTIARELGGELSLECRDSTAPLRLVLLLPLGGAPASVSRSTPWE